ncbi:tRNA lysidine(34) synthetase TilS, partial [Candidatus Peregrinibacteria bacterium]|nr:tRNA lysidine(34) synthetase TilS [Candidatus Peregrinibacteria bacterium]
MPRNRNKTADQKTLETLKKHLKGGETLIVGISGGPDSVFLLHMLLKFTPKLNIVVAHINHALRGIEAELDTDFVKNLAKKHKIPFKHTKIDIATLSRAKKKSVEETGRDIRYKFFNKLYKDYKADYILTAHHLDDNLETILLNFIRGSNLQGITGIQETSLYQKTRNVLRPLLNISKQEIVEYLQDKHILYRIDATNEDRDIPRNFLRHEVIPKLKELNPSLPKTVLRNSKNFKEIQALLEKEAKAWIRGNKISSQTFDLKSLQTLPAPIQKEILIQIYKEAEGDTKNIESIHLDEVLSIINKNVGNKK